MSGEEWPDGQAPSAAELDAATWCARIRDGLADDELADLGEWFRASDANREAFENAMLVAPLAPRQRSAVEHALMHRLPALAGVARTVPNRQSSSTPDSRTSSRKGRQGVQTKRKWRPVVLAAAALAATVALTLGIGTKLVPASLAPSARAATYETGHGAIRRFTLDDGSALTLDSDSRVEVTMDSGERRARLLHGRARLAAARDRRPFSIVAGAGVAGAGRQVAFDGVIDIGIGEDRSVDLRLRSGTGELKAGGEDSDPEVAAVPLPIDQQVVFPAVGAAAPKVVAAPVADTRAWPSGLVDYREITLDALTRDANRYARRPIVLDDPTLAMLTVSGRFQLTDSKRLAGRLGEVFDLIVSRRADGIHLGRRRKISSD
jgi:transmembrane sensor